MSRRASTLAPLGAAACGGTLVRLSGRVGQGLVAALLTRFVSTRHRASSFLGVVVSFSPPAGVSRVCLGVHDPSDVLADWVVGTGWAWLFWTLARVLQREGAVEPPRS